MMKQKTLALLAAAAFSLASSVRDESPAFGVDAGERLEKSFRTDVQFALEDANITFNGEEADLAQVGMPEDLEVSAGYELGCSDSYESMGDERPLVLLRSFDALRVWYEDQDGEGDEEEPTELVGKTVRFAWNDEEELYDKSFVGEGGDEGDLDDLREDLDLRALLPDREVAEGDTWSTDGIVFLELWLPGIDVRAKLEGGELGDAPPELVEAVVGMIEGMTLECTYEGSVEEDGAELGQIGLAASLEDVVPVPPDFVSEGEEGPSFTWDHFDASVELDFEGTLLWNLAEGRFHSFEGKSEGSAELDFAFTIEDFGLDIAGTMEFSLGLENSSALDPGE